MEHKKKRKEQRCVSMKPDLHKETKKNQVAVDLWVVVKSNFKLLENQSLHKFL